MRMLIKLMLISLVALGCLASSAEAATFSIYNCWWGDRQDKDGDNYTRQRTLYVDADVSTGSAFVYFKVWYRVGSGSWVYKYLSPMYQITGTSTADIRTVAMSNIPHGVTDFWVNLYTLGGTYQCQRNHENDADLNDEKFETAAQDPYHRDLTASINSPEPVKWGDTFTVTGRIYNKGALSAVASTARIYISSNSNITGGDYYLGSVSIASIAGKGNRSYSKSVTLPSTPPSGFTLNDVVYVGVIADATGVVIEYNEGNNTRYDMVSVTPRPDLTVSYMNATPEPLKWGDAFSASITIRNLTTVTAGSSIAKIYISSNSNITGGDYYLGSVSVASIAAGGSRGYTKALGLPSSPPSGFAPTDTLYIGVIADATSAVPESNEGNNTKYDMVSVTPILPDLTVTTMNVMPEPLKWGDAFNAAITIRNLATVTAGSSTAKIYISDNPTITGGDYYLGAVSVAAIAAHGTRAYTKALALPVSPPSGFTPTDTLYIGVIADATSAVPESNEGNNTKYDQVAVKVGWDVGYTPLAGGWRRLSWFGDYVPLSNGWIFHQEHDYMHIWDTSTSQSVYIYTVDLGWLWTKSTMYPYMYRFSSGAWLYYLKGTDNPRQFYNMSTQVWETH